MTDDRNRWERVKDIFQAALSRSPEEWTAYLDQTCSDDDILRTEVDSMLRAHVNATAASFAGQPAIDALAVAQVEVPLSLVIGQQLGHYRIEDVIGAGGMGIVYRARDTRPKLDRIVAIKVLTPDLRDDPELLRRFEREGRALAALNHPHICAVFDVGQADGIDFLVMEYVAGETLAERLTRSGALPVREALQIAIDVAGALEAAHEHGIVHRDLKPANIKIRDDGTVKVLDFGLAKAMTSPTVSGQRTQPGIILGTAAYMSPEQAAAKPVDKRTDLWAFGVVLLEMLTGRRVFEGETASHVLAAILAKEPDWTALPARTPAAIRRLLRRCLEKDRKRRLDSAADARLEIEDALAEHAGEFPSTAAPERASRYIIPPALASALAVAVVAVLAILAVAVVAVLAMRAFTRAPSPESSRFRIVPPAVQPMYVQGDDHDIAITPDGRNIVYLAALNGGGDYPALAVRSLDQLDAKIVSGGVLGRAPFVSPDGEWIGFFARASGPLKKISIRGGPPVTLCNVNSEPRGASWGPDNTIIFATSDPSTGLLRVSAGGGDPTVLTTPDTAGGETDHVNPFVLPGGHAVLFTILMGRRQIDDARIGVLDLQTGRRKILIRGGVDARYVDTGHLVYTAAGTLRAVGFDLGRLEVTGTPVPIAEDVTIASTGAANFVLAQNGTLVYVAGGGSNQRQLVWVDRNGREAPITAPPRAYTSPRISPDGTRVAVDLYDQENDVWVWDLARETLTRLTLDPGNDRFPVWTPDGRRIIFNSNRSGSWNLYWQASDNTGIAERLTTSSNIQIPSSMSPDGSRLIFAELRPKTGLDVMMLELNPTPATTVTRTPQPLVQTTFAELDSRVSPNGRWIAYQSNESGMPQIHVRPFPNVDAGHWQVSTNGGTRPVWARNGRELFYQVNGAMMVVPVQTTGSIFSPGNPTKLFDAAPYYFGIAGHTFDVSADGQKFLMIKNAAASDQNAAPSLIVAEHWTEQLQTRVPTK
jgi:serine/threonine-protein kinase